MWYSDGQQALINNAVANVMQKKTDFNHIEVALLTGMAGLTEFSHHFIDIEADLILVLLRGNTPLQDKTWYGTLCIS